MAWSWRSEVCGLYLFCFQQEEILFPRPEMSILKTPNFAPGNRIRTWQTLRLNHINNGLPWVNCIVLHVTHIGVVENSVRKCRNFFQWSRNWCSLARELFPMIYWPWNKCTTILRLRLWFSEELCCILDKSKSLSNWMFSCWSQQLQWEAVSRKKVLFRINLVRSLWILQ